MAHTFNGQPCRCGATHVVLVSEVGPGTVKKTVAGKKLGVRALAKMAREAAQERRERGWREKRKRSCAVTLRTWPVVACWSGLAWPKKRYGGIDTIRVVPIALREIAAAFSRAWQGSRREGRDWDDLGLERCLREAADHRLAMASEAAALGMTVRAADSGRWPHFRGELDSFNRHQNECKKSLDAVLELLADRKRVALIHLGEMIDEAKDDTLPSSLAEEVMELTMNNERVRIVYERLRVAAQAGAPTIDESGCFAATGDEQADYAAERAMFDYLQSPKHIAMIVESGADWSEPEIRDRNGHRRGVSGIRGAFDISGHLVMEVGNKAWADEHKNAQVAFDAFRRGVAAAANGEPEPVMETAEVA